ncbi:MAG: hypothetical protein ABJD07_16900, partial [Gemmatimonadaceae bacterium]
SLSRLAMADERLLRAGADSRDSAAIAIDHERAGRQIERSTLSLDLPCDAGIEAPVADSDALSIAHT